MHFKNIHRVDKDIVYYKINQWCTLFANEENRNEKFGFKTLNRLLLAKNSSLYLYSCCRRIVSVTTPVYIFCPNRFPILRYAHFSFLSIYNSIFDIFCRVLFRLVQFLSCGSGFCCGPIVIVARACILVSYWLSKCIRIRHQICKFF